MTGPPLGTIIYLASAMIKVSVTAEKTYPDTPDMYGAKLDVMGDQGDMDLDPLMGQPGTPGRALFAFRQQDTPIVNNPSELPTNLTNTPHDIGKYWLIDTVDDEGLVTSEMAWTWYGTDWRVLAMGAQGPPGAVPRITPSVVLIDPSQTSHVQTSGPRYAPTWQFDLAEPAGIPGPVKPFRDFADFDDSVPPLPGYLVGCTGEFTADGLAIWKPFNIRAYDPGPWSVPESAFRAYQGFSQQAPIGSFIIPPQPWPWTPIVWGHLGSAGLTLTSNPLMIGAQILLGDPKSGIQIARGLGNTLGEVNIFPHYSTSMKLNQTMMPTSGYAVVPANHTHPAQGEIFMNLWNDGQLGVYDFDPKDAQLFVMALPIEPFKADTSRATTRRARR